MPLATTLGSVGGPLIASVLYRPDYVANYSDQPTNFVTRLVGKAPLVLPMLIYAMLCAIAIYLSCSILARGYTSKNDSAGAKPSVSEGFQRTGNNEANWLIRKMTMLEHIRSLFDFDVGYSRKLLWSILGKLCLTLHLCAYNTACNTVLPMQRYTRTVTSSPNGHVLVGGFGFTVQELSFVTACASSIGFSSFFIFPYLDRKLGAAACLRLGIALFVVCYSCFAVLASLHFSMALSNTMTYPFVIFLMILHNLAGGIGQTSALAMVDRAARERKQEISVHSFVHTLDMLCASGGLFLGGSFVSLGIHLQCCELAWLLLVFLAVINLYVVWSFR